MAGANAMSIVVMWLVGHADQLNPADHPMLSNAGLAFPVFIAINACFFLFWLFTRRIGLLLSALAVVACWGPLRRYCPVNIPHDPPAGALKVISYNVWNFNVDENPGKPNKILEYLQHQDADIVALQEAPASRVGKWQLDSILGSVYPHRDTLCRAGDCIMLLSKYPIRKKELIPYESVGNMSGAFTINVRGEDVIVVNNHLETTALSIEEKERFSQMLHGRLQTGKATRTSKWLIRHLGNQTRKRAPEAEAVARFIAYHRDTPLIVCGDFNDSSLSYAHRIISRGLTDCFTDTGLGPGISYHKSGFYVRIDNILCSSDFKPYACRVDNSIASSDHYPILCWLKMATKSK